MFDLDFRKNLEPAIREAFGAPVIEVPNLHPDLRVSLQLGTSDSSKTVGVATTLDWFLGVNGFDKVSGVIGGYFSSIALGVAANAEVFKVPQVAFGATNTFLSDKTAYPWFLRTIPPDSFQGAAMWTWMNYFAIPSVTFLYRKREVYGEGLWQIALDSANSVGQAARVSGIGNELVDDDAADVETIGYGLALVRGMGTKFIIIVFSDPLEITMAMYAMEQARMLYDSYQVLGADSFGSSLVGNDYVPSRGYPSGVQKFTPVTRGELYPKFLEMWRKMTPGDVYGEDAVTRYKLDRLHVPLLNGSAPFLSNADFQEGAPWFFSQFLFDTGYTYIHAINNLLNAGVQVKAIHGEILLEELKRTTFEGVTGFVSFDRNSDRVGDFELWNVRMEGGEFTSVATWSASYSTFSFRVGEKNLTWAGGIVGAIAPLALVACAPGQRWDEQAGLCIDCPRNWYSPGGVGPGSACVACVAGQISSTESGADSCVLCEPGTFRSAADERCEMCPAGSIATGPGQSACVECPVGQFASGKGMQACSVCGAGLASLSRFKTMTQIDINGEIEYTYLQGATSPHQCGCDRGSRKNAEGECMPCGEGVLCKGMSDVAIQPGYYASAMVDYHLSVFRCHAGHSQCLGGIPGFTCAEGREGISCADCKESMRPSSGGGCVECLDTDWWPFAAALMFGVVSLVTLYHFLDRNHRAKQSHASLLFACTVGQVVTTTQQLGVIGMLHLRWEQPLDSSLHVLGLLTFNTESFRLGCIGAHSALQRFGFKLFLIFVTTAIMLAIHVAFVLCRHRGMFRRRFHCFISAIGTLLVLFNIAVTSTALQPLQCQGHPNGMWTAQAYPGILCWTSEEHYHMLLLGALAFCAWPLACLAACTVVVYQMPQRVRAGDTEFLKAFAFLFMRFRASCYSYALIHVFRSFFVAVIVIVPDILFQIFILNMVLLLAENATLCLWPWRVQLANVLDCVFAGCTLIFACTIAVFLPEESRDLSTTAWMMVALVVCLLAVAPVAIAYAGFRKFRSRFRKHFQYFLCHHAGSCGAFARLLKMTLRESTPKKVFLAADHANVSLDDMFDIIGNDTKNFLLLCTKEVFTHPWCVGQMCIAQLRAVRACVLLFPGSCLPDEEFIQDLDKRIWNLDILTESGLSKDILQLTFRWLMDQLLLDVPRRASPPAMASLAECILGRAKTLDFNPIMSMVCTVSVNTPETQCVSVYDRRNMEAAATAEILKRCLAARASKLVPEPLLDWGTVKHVAAVVVLCTHGLFDNTHSLDILAGISVFGESAPRLVPVLCDPYFSFPTAEKQSDLEALGIAREQAEVVLDLASALLKEIAIQFMAMHMGEAQMERAAKSVALRLQEGTGSTTRMSTQSVGLSSRQQGFTEEVKKDGAFESVSEIYNTDMYNWRSMM